MNRGDLKFLLDNLIDYAYDNKWHLYIAKFGRRQSSLLAHSLTVADLSVSLLNFVEAKNLRQDAQKRLLIAAFFHDFEKVSESFQRSITGECDDYTHIYPEKLLEVLKSNRNLVSSLGLSDKEISSIVTIYAFQGKRPESAIHLIESTRAGVYGDEEFLSRILTLADGLASKKSVSEVKNLKIDDLLGSNIIDYHEIAIVRGILTQILHNTLEEEAVSLGLTPILWYPEGTVYLGQSGLNLNIDKIKKKFEEKVRKFIENANEVNIASAVFGGIGQTVVKSPEILFSSDRSVRTFLDNMRYRYAKLSVLQRSPEESVFNLLLIAKGIVIALCEKTSLEEGGVVKKLKEMVIDKVNLKLDSDQLKRLAHTLPRDEKQEVFKVINDGIKTHQDPESFVDDLCNHMLEFGKWCREQYIKECKSELIKEVSELIVNEIAHPFSLDKKYSEESYRAYVTGKTKGTPICVFCGNKAEKELVASLVEGGGSESFINLLIGGSKIGGSNKAMICKVCELELMLRSLLGRGQSPSVFFVFPQFNVSRESVAMAKEGLEAAEITPIDDLIVLSKKIVDNGCASVVKPFKLKELLLLKEENSVKSWIAKRKLEMVKKFVENNIDVIANYLVGNLSKEKLEEMKTSEIAEAIINGSLKISNEDLNKELIGILSSFEYVYQTGNYVMFVADVHKGKYDTDDTLLIRKIYLSLILSIIFQGIVYVQETNETFVLNEIHGVVRYTPSLGIRDIEKSFGWMNGWVPISFSIEKTIEKLSSAFQIENYFHKAQQGNKGFLLEIMREAPGKILNKYVISVKHFPPELVSLLDKLAQEIDGHRLMVTKEVRSS